MKSWPVLVGIAVVGSVSGVAIAGRDQPVGTVTAAPLLIEVDPATISSTSSATSATDTSGGAATLGSSSTSIVQSSPVVPSPGSTTTTIVLSSPVVPSPGSTTTTTTVLTSPVAPSPGATTTTTTVLSSPVAPSPGSATTSTTTTTTVLTSPVGPTPAPSDAGNGGPPDTDRTPLRLVVAGADGRTGLADATAVRLTALGYANVRIARAIAPVEFTIIYFRSGFNREAVTVATDLQADDPILEEWSFDAANPLTDADDTGDVIVLLGSDAPG